MIWIAATLAVTLNVSAKSDAAKKWDEEAALRKADYVFLQSADALSDNRTDDYTALVRYANRLAPNDINIAAELGGIVLSSTKDSAEVQRAYASLRRLFISKPDDYETGSYLSSVAKKLGKLNDLEMVWTKLDSAYPNRNEPALNLATVNLTKYIMGDTAAFRRCISIYNRIEDGFGVDPGISSYKIRAHFLRKDTAAIISELHHLNEALPNRPESLVFTGQTFSALSMPDSALYYYDLACQSDSTIGEIHLVRADFFKEQGDSAAYDREVFSALTSPNLEFEPKLELITNYVRELFQDRTQMARIKQMFNTVLEVHPGESELYRLYGIYLSIIDENDSAAEQLNYSISLDPTNEDCWKNLMQLYSSTQNNEKAAEVALKATPRFPDDAYFPLVGALALHQLSRTTEGIALLDSFNIERFENLKAVSNFYGTRADLLYAIDQRDSAFVYYEKALAADPENYMAMNNAAYYISQSENPDLDRAERYSRMAVRAEPNNPTYLDTYAWVCFKKKDYQEARRYIDKTIEAFDLKGLPSDWKVQCDSVYEVADTANVVPDDVVPDVQDTAGVSVEDMLDDYDGELVEMLDEEPEGMTYEDVLNEVGKDVLEHAGDIYFMTGEPDAALQFWEAALSLDKDNELLKRKVKNKTYFFK
jgi:tetratricopeptide (TPR) repeat protein